MSWSLIPVFRWRLANWVPSTRLDWRVTTVGTVPVGSAWSCRWQTSTLRDLFSSLWTSGCPGITRMEAYPGKWPCWKSPEIHYILVRPLFFIFLSTTGAVLTIYSCTNYLGSILLSPPPPVFVYDHQLQIVCCSIARYSVVKNSTCAWRA